MRRAAFASFVLFDLTLAIAIGSMAIGYARERTWMSLDDRLVLYTPLAATFAALLTTLWVYGRRTRPLVAPITRWMLHLKIHVLLAMFAARLLLQYSLIAHDGTAYWGLIFMPCILIGLPLLIAALIVGGIADIIVSVRRRPKNAVAE